MVSPHRSNRCWLSNRASSNNPTTAQEYLLNSRIYCFFVTSFLWLLYSFFLIVFDCSLFVLHFSTSCEQLFVSSYIGVVSCLPLFTLCRSISTVSVSLLPVPFAALHCASHDLWWTSGQAPWWQATRKAARCNPTCLDFTVEWDVINDKPHH